MLTKIRKRALLAAVLTLLTAPRAWPQSTVGSRAAGMAGAFVAVADDATAVYWNPAGIATGSFVSAVIDFGRGERAPKSPQTAAGQKDTVAFVGVSATAIGLAYFRLETYGTSTAEPVVTAPQSREEVRRSVQALTTSTVGVSLLQSLTEHIVVGVTPKFIRGSARRGVSGDLDVHDALDTAKGLDGPGDGAFDVDAGAMVRANRFRFGVIARNLTTPSFDAGAGQDPLALEREVRVGGAWGSGWSGLSRVIVSVDGDLTSRATPSGDRRDVAAGVETWWRHQRLGLRGGARRSTIGDPRAAVAAGISAGLTSGMFVDAHVVRGHAAERAWSVGARMVF